MDEKGFAGKVEQAYVQMFERWATRTAVGAVEASPSADEMNGLVALFNDEAYAQGAEILHLLVERYPRHGYSWKLLGSFLQKLNQVAPALQAKQRAVQLLPNDMEALFNLAMAYEQQGMVLKAEPCYRSLTAHNPADAEAHHNLGNSLLRQGRYAEAMPCYRESLRLEPDSVASHHSLAWLLQNLGQLVEAESVLRSLLQLVPRDVQVSMQLGRVLLRQGRRQEAKVCIRNAAVEPEDAEANPVQQGNSFMELGLWSDAEAEFRKALEIDATADQVWVNLANCLKDQFRLVEANQCALQAIEVNPGSMVAWATHASVMLMVGDRNAAEAGFRRAMALPPLTSANFSSLLFALNYDPDRSPEEIYENYAEYDRQFGVVPAALLAPHDNPPAARRRLKVGYVSPDFRNHVCTFFIEPLLSQHDANLVEVYAYAELKHEDASSQRYKGYVEHWVPTMGMSDMALAQRIRADGIDVLVDLAGHTSGNRLGVFAYKPAPVSLSWMGYGYTTGLRSIDYYLTDVVGAPMGSEHLFAEAPWRLPDTAAWVYRPPQAVMGAVNLLPALERGYVTIGTLTRGIRVNPLTIRVWASILHRLPTAHIVIDSSSFKDHSVQQSMVDQFTALGIAEDRLHIGFSSPPWDVLRGIDIGLDCFPHNSGTTLFETLYMGLPYVTLAGRPSVGRLGSTILQGLGRSEWIAHTEDEYIEKVVALASDLPALAHIRATQRSKMEASQLMDEPGFARKVEAAYAQMFALWEEKNA
ncbi:MAG: tetratricopeptide repeat protein [Ferruginibacter sp.]|nr:tetratricopeptide repeat protein [Rhodoferax sp.]